MIRDQQIQSMQSASIRNAIAELTGSEKTFRVLNEHVSEDVLMDIFSQKARESFVQAHDALITNRKEKLIGVNIVEKLEEQYGASDKQTELDKFARHIMWSSGVFLFDKAEIFRHLNNNVASQTGRFMYTTLITIPESPENKEFTDKLADAFKRYADSTYNIHVDRSRRKNEITVTNLISCFSLRMVNEVKILKQEYDRLLQGIHQEEAKLFLHLEGDGSQYPDVFTND
jgi:hypothetical protein